MVNGQTGEHAESGLSERQIVVAQHRVGSQLQPSDKAADIEGATLAFLPRLKDNPG